ncbi:coatomer subunit delta [Trichuris trichiura]|uniref:Coatomer subunit delta n=1 Tax=Trichuris trichiura TaxID=36087 RepID=A0A077Z4G4_TRITR|nr:coatomer subunit delta [Trichuris trichiura]
MMSRQFVEMTRSRVEGLLTAFPKLLFAEKSTTRQHTFIETESVRYVYQPIDQLYVFLITTKASNILEDLETLKLFSRVVPEYCQKADEKSVMDHVFELVFAFDEIVALGYRENVNLSQICTYVDMDSHDERVYYQIKKSQEEEARKLAKDKARELAKAKQEAAKRGGTRVPHSMFGGFGPAAAKSEPTAVVEQHRELDYHSPPVGANKKYSEDWPLLNDLLILQEFTKRGKFFLRLKVTPKKRGYINSVHVKMEEKINVKQKRDGGLDKLEVLGAIILRISDEKYCQVMVKLGSVDVKGVQIQTHPNLDKKAFQNDGILMLKNQSRPFPLNTDAGPFSFFKIFLVNCWPSDGRKGCDVNIEYTLDNERLQLEDVCITVPLPYCQLSTAPVIAECDGEYQYDRAHQCLRWRLPLIDSSNKQGALEFTTASGTAANFFPITVQFTSKILFCPMKASNRGLSAKFSLETKLSTDVYEIL